VNLGSCVLNKTLPLAWYERAFMGLTTVVLFAVEITLAKTKPNALFFIVCILIGGLMLRAYAQRRGGLASAELPEKPEYAGRRAIGLASNTTAILVAARGITPVLRFAIEEAQLRGAALYVLYVRAVAVGLPGALTGAEPTRWQEDTQAAEIMHGVFELGQESGIKMVPVYAVSDDPAATIIDAAAKTNSNMVILGAPHRRTLVSLLKGDVVTEIAGKLPEHISLLIHG